MLRLTDNFSSSVINAKCWVKPLSSSNLNFVLSVFKNRYSYHDFCPSTLMLHNQYTDFLNH